MQIGSKPHGAEIPLADLHEVLDGMIQRVNQSARSTWRWGGELVDPNDVRWISSQIERFPGEALRSPWPGPDQPRTGQKWRWQGYSPELALEIVTGVLRDAVNGYRDLVEENFASFGGTLGLNSVLPVRVEGVIELPQDDVDGTHSEILYELKPDPGTAGEAVTAVHLSFVTDPGSGPYTHLFTAAVDRRRTPFYRPVAHNTLLPLGQFRPATNLAYEWLAADLHAVGWLDNAPRFDDLPRCLDFPQHHAHADSIGSQ
jgi:hypothetical protein